MFYLVEVACSPSDLLASLGVRPPAVPKGVDYAGMVVLPNERLKTAYNSMKAKLKEVADSENDAGSFVLELTEDEMVALFYEVTVYRVNSSYTALEVTEFNFPVIKGLIEAGFVFPDKNNFYF